MDCTVFIVLQYQLSAEKWHEAKIYYYLHIIQYISSAALTNMLWGLNMITLEHLDEAFMAEHYV